MEADTVYENIRGLSAEFATERRERSALSYGCPATIFRDILAAVFGRLRAVKGQSPH